MDKSPALLDRKVREPILNKVKVIINLYHNIINVMGYFASCYFVTPCGPKALNKST